MAIKITVAQLVAIAEGGERLDYMGTFTVSGEMRAYYRTSGIAGEKPFNFLLVYVVVP